MKTLNDFGLSLLMIICIYINSFSQDSLSIEVLKPISYSFELEDNNLTGEGADFLLDKLSKAQFTLLGEYHGSKNISMFTETLIPQLSKSDYRYLVLEVGPNTGRFLDHLPSNKNKVISELKNLNRKYVFEIDRDVNYPIPFFDKLEDARFLGEAKVNGWKVIGIDQEFVDGFMMQVDWMYENLDLDKKEEFRLRHAAVRDTLFRFYNEWESKHISPSSAILESQYIQDYLGQMTQELKNRALVVELKKSIEIYHLNTIRKWYDSNNNRIKYMKKRLRLGLEDSGFDISRDKLLIKMGGYHMSQGFSPLGFYEVGNTLNEIAEYHGHSAVNIGFINRFSMDDGTLMDVLESENRYIDSHRNFYAMGAQDQWVVIDLAPLREGFYYHPVKYFLNEYEEKLIQRYDLLIVTPTEYPGIKNY